MGFQTYHMYPYSIILFINFNNLLFSLQSVENLFFYGDPPVKLPFLSPLLLLIFPRILPFFSRIFSLNRYKNVFPIHQHNYLKSH